MAGEQMKTSANFTSHSLRPVFSRGKFQIDMLDVAGLGIIYDPEVGHGDRSIHNLQPMPISDVHSLVFWVLGRVRFAQGSIEFLFQFIVQYHTSDSASVVFNF